MHTYCNFSSSQSYKAHGTEATSRRCQGSGVVPPQQSQRQPHHTTPLTALGQDPKGPAGTGKKRSFTKQSTCLGLPAGLPALTAADSLEVFFSPSSGMPWTLSSAQNTL